MPRELKVGMVLWSVRGDYEYGSSLEEWVIRSIKCARRSSRKWLTPHIKEKGAMTVFLVQKNSSTWVKKSKKHFDYGWDNSIPDLYRKSFTISSYEEKGLPNDLSFSKSGAYLNHIRNLKSSLERTKKYRKKHIADGDSDEEIKMWDEIISNTIKHIEKMKRKHKKVKELKK
ncbi:hypothetical protein KAU43_05030 [candidate division WOR-3 bacterium]|nr:hypothetical protein [candidate division WOR-3 bacterium]